MVRRIVMWAAGLVLILLMIAWCVSLVGVAWGTHQRPLLALTEGNVLLTNLPQVENPRLHVMQTHGWASWWLPRGWSGEGFWVQALPLWIPAAAAGAVFAPAWLAERRARIRVIAGRCFTCGYDLTGITGPCPECGSEKQEREG